MRLAAILFLLGIITGYYDQFNNGYLVLLACFGFLVLFFIKKSYLVYYCALLLGFIWLHINIAQYNHWQLPYQLQKKSLTIQATVITIPKYQDHILSFDVKTKQAKLKLSWYLYKNQMPAIKAGQVWQLNVKLKRPHCLKNPGGFNYCNWLLMQGIQATGYITHGHKLKNHNWHYPLVIIRQIIKNSLDKLLKDNQYQNFIVALTIGVRENISQQQWQILQNTGTNHLIAIAGLHIGLITGLIFFLVNIFWRRIPSVTLYIPSQQIAAVAALLMAWLYAALAGFSLPTERAVIMISVFMFAIIKPNKLPAWSAWCLALVIILLLNPLSILSAGFWLSFTAVALIIFTVSGRVAKQTKLSRLFKVQFILALGLAPLTMLFFNNASIIAPIANMLVIPIVGFLTVPLSLLAILFSFISKNITLFLLHYASLSMHLAWLILSWFSSKSFFTWHMSLSIIQTIAVFIAVTLIMLPKGIAGRYLALFFALPLFVNLQQPIKYGEVNFTVLDVGQGLATVMRTQHHVLIYDTGPRFGVNYDMGAMVVIPYLENQHIKNIDRIVISHGDNDHIGGLQSIIKSYPPRLILTSVPKKIHYDQVNYCLAGQHWQWDGVSFEMLYPTNHYLDLDNNSSCVLKVSSKNQQILLTGDIEKKAERFLVKRYGHKLQATVLVAPHHGSKTSSSKKFIAMSKPKYVVFATGYLNRFHFPNHSIVARYKKFGVMTYNTARLGAISFDLLPDKVTVKTYGQYSII